MWFVQHFGRARSLNSIHRSTAEWLFLSLLFCLVLGWNSFAFAGPSVAVYVSPPRGGFGDTAANLLMIERMAERYMDSDSKFSVVYSKESIEQLHALWPDFKPNLDVQIVRGILFQEVSKATKADVAVSFSANDNAPENLGKRFLTYWEYEQPDFELGSQAFRISKKDYQLHSEITGISLSDSSVGAKINTGFGNGIYVMNGYRPSDFDKQKTLGLLREFSPSVGFSDQAKLAYAYASSKELAQQYVNSLGMLNEKYGHEIVVVTNQPVLTDNPNIKVIDMKGLSFNLNQKVIKSSDIPILVTGDGSLSLAIEGRKPFFYSLYAWKRFTPVQLRKAIEKASPMLKKDRRSLDLISSLFRLDIAGNHSYENQFLAVMENPALQQEISRVYDIFVKTDSLVDLVERDIEVISNLKPNLKNEIHGVLVKMAWKIVRKSENFAQAMKKIEKMVFTKSKDAEQRVRYLFSMHAFSDYSDQRFADLLSKALTAEDVELRAALNYRIEDAFNSLKLMKIYPLLTLKAQNEFRLILKNLAAQDSAQWYSESAAQALKEITKLEHEKACRALYGY
jgi:hypothetical protein